MAYVATEDNEPNAQNVATNIFQNTMGQQQQQPAAGGGAPGGAQGMVAGGDQSQAIDAGGPSSPNKSQGMPNTAASSKEVIRRNSGKMQSPIDVKELSSNMNQARQSLQNEANNYVGSQSGKSQAIDDGTIQKALTEGGSAFDQVGGRLNQAKPGYVSYNPSVNTDYTSQINQLQDNSLRNYFKNAGGPMATQGEAAFDTMLLNKNNDFKRQRDEAALGARTLADDTARIRGETDTKGKAAYDTGYDTETQRERSTIQNLTKPVLSKAEAAAEAENKRRADLSAGVKAKGSSALLSTVPNYQKWITDIGNQVGTSPAEKAYLQRLIAGGLSGQPETDPTGGLSLTNIINSVKRPSMNDITFASLNNTPLTANNYLSSGDASLVNRGNQLLGQKAPTYAASTPGDAINLNQNAARAYLSNALTQHRGDLSKMQEETLAGRKAVADAASRKQLMETAAAGNAKAREEVRRLQRLDQLPKELNSWVDNNFTNPVLGKNSVAGQAFAKQKEATMAQPKMLGQVATSARDKVADTYEDFKKHKYL